MCDSQANRRGFEEWRRNPGRHKTPGVTFPSAKAQEALARKVYAQAGLDPLETTYIESHGTGTQAGDPVEASALFMNFGKNRSDPIHVGTVKSNVGHLVSLTLF